MTTKEFEDALKKLNKEQKEAVDTIDGPVMVVAGPGTGKTQILSLRIGNILRKTDTGPSGILCLTFTNSGVEAMRERLRKYLGSSGSEVTVSTFHSFSIGLIEKYYDYLGFEKIPELMGDNESVFLIDNILRSYKWDSISPLFDSGMYYKNIKQLISLLKRERITAEEMLVHLNGDIEEIKNNPNNISSRGARKGELKMEILNKIKSLERTRELISFYELYEQEKKKLGLMDYDDVLEHAVYLAENVDEARTQLRENYLYVLVDEHQDSSGVQNSFLKAVWKDVEMPNIFVVGDDRQLIYGFSGANLSYFEEFSHIFGKTKLIVLRKNYRSTKEILTLADEMLSSSINPEKLESEKGKGDKINLNSFSYPRDEIIGAGLYFKEKIQQGVSPNECALLLRTNYQIKEAVNILIAMGLPVSDSASGSLFDQKEFYYIKRVLEIMSDPYNPMFVSSSLLDKSSGIDPLVAHTFLRSVKKEKPSVYMLLKQKQDLFGGGNQIYSWGKTLEKWINQLQDEQISNVVSIIGNELLIDKAKDNEELLTRVEVVRSLIHLALILEEKNPRISISSFVEYLNRLISYNVYVGLSRFDQGNGIKVMTFHKSKGLEFDVVWIAHLTEKNLSPGRGPGFVLPEKIQEHIQKKGIEEIKRELYVAITRTKKDCNLSYSEKDYKDTPLVLSSLIEELPENLFNVKNAKENEKNILKTGASLYALKKAEKTGEEIDNIRKLVKDNFTKTKVSVTLLDNFFECPWKWYFRSFLMLPEPKAPHLIIGTISHKIVEVILKEKLFKEKEIKERIELEIERNKIENEIEKKRIKERVESSVFNWLDTYHKDVSRDFEPEKPISVRTKDFPDLLLCGKLDLIEYEKNQKLRITDFKTGKSKTKNEIEKLRKDGRMSDSMRQLAMYHYLTENSDLKNFHIEEIKLLYLEEEDNKKAVYRTQIDEGQIELLKKDINDYREGLIDGSFTDMPCNFKSYGASKESCPYCELAENIFKKNNQTKHT